MEDKKLSEKESLELITTMIHNARTNLRAKINCNILLLWGYTIIIVSLLVWVMKKYELFLYSSLLWFLIPLIWYPATKYLYSKDKTHIKSYLDKTIDYISIVFIVVCSVMALTSIWVSLPVLFIEGILLNIWIIIVGILIKYKPLIGGGMAGFVISYGLLFASEGIGQIPVFAIIPIFAIIIPGHLLKKSVSKNV